MKSAIKTQRIKTPYGTYVTEVAPDGKTVSQRLEPSRSRPVEPTPDITPKAAPCGCGGSRG